MKPIKIKMQAFGAYINEETVDFSVLNKNSLFLITGSTGGGKTTILDAMCFALYGKATGGLRSWSSMRCIGAPNNLPTIVEYTFSLGDKEYLFYRSQVLHSNRKTGEPVIKGENALYQKDGIEWAQIFSGAESKLTEKAEELLGLDCDQFSKVIILPQGEFRKLLLSSSNEKGKIFEKLFSMSKWSVITGKIMAMADKLKKDADNYRIQREEALHSQDVITTEQLKEKSDKLNEQYKATVILAKKTDEEYTNILNSIAEQTNAKRTVEELEKTAEQITLKTEQFKKIEPVYKKAQEQSKEIPVLSKQIKEFTAKKTALFESKKKAERYSSLVKQLEEDKLALLNAQIKKTNCLNKLTETTANIAMGEKYVDDLSESLNGVSTLYAKMQILKETESLCTAIKKEKVNLESLLDNITALSQRETQAKVSLNTYKKSYAEAELLLQQNMLGHIATTLKNGELCPVCGSTTHPHLAKNITIDGISPQEKVNNLKVLKEKSEKELFDIQKTLASEKSLAEKSKIEILELTNKCGSDNNYYKIYDKELKKTEKEIEKSKKEQLLLEKAKERVKQRRKEHDTAKISEEEATIAITRIANIVLSVTEEITRIENELKDFSTDTLKISNQINTFSDYTKNAEDKIDIIQNRLTTVKTSVETVKTEIASLKHRETELVKALNSLKDAGIVYNQKLLETLHNNVLTAKDKNKEATTSMGVLEQKKESAFSVLTHIKTLENKGADIESKYSVAQRMSTFLQGKNQLKIPIKNYVLGIMLDDILLQANEYLKDLSHSRYSLNRIEERIGGNSLNGLELQIFDAEYGSTRAVNTLSGGELFLASLSLAFGLSDIIQSYSGGIRMDSIFIDEGFGSLDSETIDTAMRALNRIKNMGRTIGIISHVDQLRTQISNRIEVTDNKNGSHIKITCG